MHRHRIGRQSPFLFGNFSIADIKRLDNQLHIKFRGRKVIYEELIEEKEILKTITSKPLKFPFIININTTIGLPLIYLEIT